MNTMDRGVQTEENLRHTEREILSLHEKVCKLERQLQWCQDTALDLEGRDTSNDVDHAPTRKATGCCADSIHNLQRRLQRLEHDVVSLGHIQSCDDRRNAEQNGVVSHNSSRGETLLQENVELEKPAKKKVGKMSRYGKWKLRKDLSQNLESIEQDSKSGCRRALFILEQFENYNPLRSSWSDSMGRLFTSWQSRHYEAYKHVRGTSMMVMPPPARFSRDVLKDKETCIEWLMEQELLPRSKNCPECLTEMKLYHTRGMGRFRCQRTHASGRPFEQQVSKNTFFEGARISPKTAVLLIYAFTNKMSFEQAIKETSRQDKQTSPETVTQWYSYCRDICMDALDRKYDEGKIGGEGHIVEIDEFKISRKIYNKGRMIDGHWILGIIDHEGDFRLEIGPTNKRDRATLEDLIKKHVIPGTTIITDCWRSYTDLDQHGFIHFIVNNKYHFADPEIGANAQMIESKWRPIRKRLARGGVKNEQMTMHVCEFLWRKEMMNQKMDPFVGFLHEIKMHYPLQ